MEQLITKKRIGKTNLMVSPLCFGTSGLGNMPDTYGYEVDEKRARETLNTIFDGPVNFLDTSNNYGFGRSEERIGVLPPDTMLARVGLLKALLICHISSLFSGDSTKIISAPASSAW